jgi:KaiC/GvpD/RAD55 family RecA-like ATPase
VYDDDTPYHIKKGVDLFNAELSGNNVVIPIYNVNRERIGEQTISPDGKKLFNAGLDKSQGAFGVCGTLSGGKTYIAEGWATAGSVAMATQQPCIFALDANNLPIVCEKLKIAFPQLEIVVAADNDEKGIAAAKKTKLPWAAPAIKDKDWNDVHAALGSNAVKTALNNTKRPESLFTLVQDLKMTAPKWLINGLIEENSLAMVFGAPAAGKTFVALDIALSIACGRAYHGLDVKQGTVAYIAGEGHAGFARRVNAWCKSTGQSLAGVPFAKSNRTVVLNDPNSEDELVSELELLAEEIGGLSLIVLDTLARTMLGEENNENMMAYVQVCDRLKERFGCTVIIVHHTGHQNKDRSRGGSAMHGALDAEYRVEPWGELKVLMTPTKMKDAVEPEPIAFVKVPIEMRDEEGGDASSLVLEMTADKPTDKKSPEYIEAVILEQFNRLSDFGEVARQELKEAVSVELEISQRQANRHIKRMLDQGLFRAVKGQIVGVG